MKKTIIDLFESSVRRYPDNPFLWEKTTNAFEPTTYKEVQQQVYTAGAGLIALGVKKGDNMALLSEGRNAWIIGELAMFYAGATNVPLSIKLEEANDLQFRLVHADVKYILGFRKPAQKDTVYHGQTAFNRKSNRDRRTAGT